MNKGKFNPKLENKKVQTIYCVIDSDIQKKIKTLAKKLNMRQSKLIERMIVFAIDRME